MAPHNSLLDTFMILRSGPAGETVVSDIWLAPHTQPLPSKETGHLLHFLAPGLRSDSGLGTPFADHSRTFLCSLVLNDERVFCFCHRPDIEGTGRAERLLHVVLTQNQPFACFWSIAILLEATQRSHSEPRMINDMTKAALSFLCGLNPFRLPPSPTSSPHLYIKLPTALLPPPPLPAIVRMLLPRAGVIPTTQSPDGPSPWLTLDLTPFYTPEPQLTHDDTHPPAPTQPPEDALQSLSLDLSHLPLTLNEGLPPDPTSLTYDQQLQLALQESQRTYEQEQARRDRIEASIQSILIDTSPSEPPSQKPAPAPAAPLPHETAQWFQIAMPRDPAESSPPLSALLWFLSTPMLLKLIKALLLERRVVVHSSSLAVTSAVVAAAESLLRPFRWNNLFLTLVPEEAKEVLCAPTPYLLGVPPSVVPHLRTLELEPTFAFDLDKGNVYMLGKASVGFSSPLSPSAAPDISPSVRKRFEEAHQKRPLLSNLKHKFTGGFGRSPGEARREGSRSFLKRLRPASRADRSEPASTTPSPIDTAAGAPPLSEDDEVELILSGEFDVELLALPNWLEKSLIALSRSIEGPFDRTAEEPLRRLMAELAYNVLGTDLAEYVLPRSRSLEDPATQRIEVGWSLDREGPLTFLAGDKLLDFQAWVVSRPPAAALMLRALRHTHSLTELLRMILTGGGTGFASDLAFLRGLQERREDSSQVAAALVESAAARSGQAMAPVASQSMASVASSAGSPTSEVFVSRDRKTPGAKGPAFGFPMDESEQPDLSWETRIRGM